MSELLQFELTIPSALDAELVATRTAEQIAFNTGFDERAISEVRLSVIEACINAFERSDRPVQRIHLTFASQDGKLLVTGRDGGNGADLTTGNRFRIQERLTNLKRRWGVVFIEQGAEDQP